MTSHNFMLASCGWGKPRRGELWTSSSSSDSDSDPETSPERLESTGFDGISRGGSNCREPETVSTSGKMGWNEIEPIASADKNQEK